MIGSTSALTFGDLERYSALLRVSQALAHHRTIAELFRVLAGELHAVVPFDYLALVLHDRHTDEMRLVVLEPEALPSPSVSSLPVDAQGPASRVWQTQQPAVIPIPPAGPLHPALEFIRSFGQTVTCWLPLTTAHGPLGVLSFGSAGATDYDVDVLVFMQQVAAQVAIAVDNTINFDQSQRYEQELREERDRLHLLLEINNLLLSELDYPSLLTSISASLQRHVRHDFASLALFDHDAAELRLLVMYSRTDGISRPDVVLSLDQSPFGSSFRQRLARVFQRTEINGLSDDAAAALRLKDVQTLCCVPLVTRHGEIGTLNMARADADPFSDEEITILTQVSVQIAIAVEHAAAYQKIAQRQAELIEEKKYLEHEVQHDFGEIIGHSPALKALLTAVRTVAPTDATVLLLGETGTGKELIARAIHSLSPRHTRTFVRVTGVALPPGLFESELFGYEKGAFTGAVTGRIGRIELANRGTLFLDEVGDIPPDVQPKLLRVLQEREFERLGSTQTRRVDLRVIAATNRNLEEMVETKHFRSDLFYRLNVFPLHMPALRDRPDDIPVLARYFTRRVSQRLHRAPLSIPPHAMEALRRWSWPGNIRELQNVVERAVILSPGPELQVPVQDLQPRKRSKAQPPSPTLRETERDAILGALRETGGVIAGPLGAAARLGLKRTTLQSRMQKLGIQRRPY